MAEFMKKVFLNLNQRRTKTLELLHNSEKLFNETQIFHKNIMDKYHV